MMTSQPGPSTSTVEISSFAQDIHTYKDIWEGEALLLKCKPDNIEGKYAVAVMMNSRAVVGQVVGQVPKTLVPVISQFLK